jgi:branched-chain amino acid transport system permease protein
MLTLGGYIAYGLITGAGLPAPAGIAGAVATGAVVGGLIYVLIVRNILRQGTADFEANVMIATVGAAIALENAILLGFGGQPLKQPVTVEGSVALGALVVPWQSLIIIAAAIGTMAAMAFVLSRTGMGRAIRATAQNRDAARLMGVAVDRVYLWVLMLSGAVAAGCGVLLSSMVQLSPTLGNDPMLKAFIMCVVAGLGSLPGAVLASFVLAMLEAWVQYAFGARWGFPFLLAAVVIMLVWRPGGLLGRVQVRRM